MSGDDFAAVFDALYGIAFTIQMLAFLVTSMRIMSWRLCVTFSTVSS